MTRTEEFQKKYGPDYAKTIHQPAFTDAMLLLNLEKLDRIVNLSDEEIEKHSREILADLRGHLKHELDLMMLHERRTFDPSELPAETYDPPEPEPTKRKTKERKCPLENLTRNGSKNRCGLHLMIAGFGRG
jgi:hypothetical protein